MKDRIGKARWINQPIANKTQNIFVRFVRQPGSGLPDYLADAKKKMHELGDWAKKTRLEEL